MIENKHLYNNGENNTAREFSTDIRRFKILNEWFESYSYDPLKSTARDIRLMLNNIIILFNVFGKSTNDLLQTYIKHEYHPLLNSFLFALGNSTIENNSLNFDQQLFKIIEEIL